MPSSRSAADPLDPGPKGYAHRGLHGGGGVPENSLSAFAAAVDFGAGIECDLRLTLDDQIVVFHDADAQRLCGSPKRIGHSTLDELADLRMGTESIPTLADMLALVRGRVPLLLEVKVDGEIDRWIVPLKRGLASYEGPFGVMGFDPRLPRLLKSHLPHVRRGLNLRGGLSPLRRRLAIAVALPDYLAVEHTASGQPWVRRARRKMPVYAWTITTAAECAQAEVQADALIWEADGRPRI